MWDAIALIGFFACIIFLVMGIIALFKKNGTAKKKFLWSLIGFVAFMVGAVNSPPNTDKSAMNNISQDSASSNEEEKSKKEAEAEANAGKEAEEAAVEEAKVPRIGDTVKVGNFSVAVFEPEQSDSVGNQFLNQKAKGVFWIFPVAVRNDDKEARTVDSSMFQLVSSSGAKYDPDINANMYINQDSNFFLEKINPGITLNGFVVFDMPKDQNMAEYKMEVVGGIGFKTTRPVAIELKPKE